MKNPFLLPLALMLYAATQPAFSASADDDRGHRLWLKDQQRYREQSHNTPGSDQPLVADPLALSLEGKTYSLKNNVEDLGRALYLAINHRQFADVQRLLLPYTRLPDHDPLLVLFARAEMARDKGEYSRAIACYREILKHSPQFLRVKLELARALFEDNQNNASLMLFNQVLGEDGARLPAGTIHTIKQFTGAIEKRTSWNGSLAFGYGYNSNINQTPARDTPWFSGGALWQRQQPKGSAALSYDASLSKITPLTGHHSLLFKGTTWGDRYPHNAAFSENTTTLALQYQFSNAQAKLAIGPLGELKVSGEKRLYRGAGIKLDGEYRFTPTFLLNLSSDYQKLSYKKPYDSADGYRSNLYLTGIYNLTPESSLFAGLDGTRVTTRIRSDDYYQTGLRAGLFSALTPDIHLLAMATRRNSRFAAVNQLVGNQRQDREQMYLVRLNLPGYKLLTLTPYASYRFRRNHSNADGLYSYRQHEAIIGFETDF